MRICLVTLTYPPFNTSGVTRYCGDIARKLAERGVFIDVITSPIEKPEIKREGRITIHRIEAMRWNSSACKKTQTEELLKYLDNLTNKKKISLISAQDLHGWPEYNPGYSLATNIISLNKKIPQTLTVHSFYCLSKEPSNPARTPLQSLFWSKIIGVSGAVSDRLHELQMPFELLATSYPGVDLDNFKPDLGKKWLRTRIGLREKDLVILSAGRITDDKGIPELLKAFSIISPKYPSCKLLLAAGTLDPSNPTDLEEKIKTTYERASLLGVKDKVIIKPFSLDEMPHVYNGCDIFVLPSRSEASPMTIREAMACGLPVIGTSVGGIPEIITNGEEGYLTPVEEPIELAERLEWLLKSKKKREAMGKKGIEKVHQKFDLNKTTDKLLGIYKSAICKKNKKFCGDITPANIS